MGGKKSKPLSKKDQEKMQEKLDKVQNELQDGNGELVRSSVMVKSKKGAGGEEQKDGSTAVLMKSR